MTRRRKRAVARLYLRQYMPPERAESIRQYVEDFGRSGARIERFRSESILYVYDWRDLDIVKHEFGNLVDAWADLRR